MMDHHCSWLGGCVGWGNYKVYLLFMIYNAIMTIQLVLTLIIHLAKLNSVPKY